MLGKLKKKKNASLQPPMLNELASLMFQLAGALRGKLKPGALKKQDLTSTAAERALNEKAGAQHTKKETFASAQSEKRTTFITQHIEVSILSDMFHLDEKKDEKNCGNEILTTSIPHKDRNLKQNQKIRHHLKLE